MLYHGDYDVRVPIFHSRDFYNAVKNKEPQSEFIVFEQMGHQYNKWRPEQTAEVLENVERFLKTLCTEFAKDPAAFKSAREDELRLRYAEVGLKDNRRNLVERVCAPE